MKSNISLAGILFAGLIAKAQQINDPNAEVREAKIFMVSVFQVLSMYTSPRVMRKQWL